MEIFSRENEKGPPMKRKPFICPKISIIENQFERTSIDHKINTRYK